VTVPVITAERRWTCPNCVASTVTNQPGPHTPFHSCRGLRGLSTPFVPAGTRCKVEAREREDYVGRDLPHLDGDGRPVMSIVTTRDTGTDAVMLAPCATGTVAPPVFEALRRRLAPRRS
jgi:hypothetical protein